MYGPDDFAAECHVSRETLDRLKTYVALLKDWNTRINLVSQATLDDVWSRHVLDSAQLAPLVPAHAHRLADLGSGAGFPGLVLALLLEGRVPVTLFESTGKKCHFLIAAAEAMGLHVEIRNERVETANPAGFDVITARALAALPKLLVYAHRIAGKNATFLFPKGEGLERELTEALKTWRMKVVRHPSKTHEGSQILEITYLQPLQMTASPESAGHKAYFGRGLNRGAKTQGGRS